METVSTSKKLEVGELEAEIFILSDQDRIRSSLEIKLETQERLS